MVKCFLKFVKNLNLPSVRCYLSKDEKQGPGFWKWRDFFGVIYLLIR